MSISCFAHKGGMRCAIAALLVQNYGGFLVLATLLQ